MDRKGFLRYSASMFFAVSLAMTVALFSLPEARALGFLMIDSSAFLRKDTQRGDTSTTIALGPNIEGESTQWGWKLDLQGFAFLSSQSSLTIEAANAYFATSRDWNLYHQFTLGRRHYNWSEADRSWSLGMISPRFLWDPLRPEVVGLTGFFHTYETPTLQTSFFASPITVPERGFPIRADNTGRVVAESPFWVSPPSSIMLQGRETPIRYSIPDPDLKRAVFRPSILLKSRFGRETGGWVSVLGGLLPVHQNDIAIDPLLSLPANEFQAKLYPRFHSRTVASVETGYRFGIGNVWASVFGDRPIVRSVPENASTRTITRPLGNAIQYSAGGALTLADQLRLSGAVLHVAEKAPTPDAASQIFPTDTLQSRFVFERAYQFGVTWESDSPWIIDSRFIRDTKNTSSLASFDFVYRPVRYVSPGAYTGGFNTAGSGWSIGIGADFIESKTGTGWIGQYVGNDRVRGRFSYAF